MPIQINGIIQGKPSEIDYGPGVQDITELKTVGPSSRFDRHRRYVEDEQIAYHFNLQNSSAESLPDLVEPDDSPATGRWERVNAGGGAPAAHGSTHKGDGSDPVPAVTVAVNGLMIASDKVKLNGIEALADVTDATNVAAAGALMQDGSETVKGDILPDGNNTRTFGSAALAYAQILVNAVRPGTGSSLVLKNDAGAFIVDIKTDGTINFRGSVTVETNDAFSLAASAKAFKEILVNIIQPGTGKEVNFQSENGTLAFLYSNNAVTIHRRLQPNGTNTIAVGTTALAFKEILVNIVQPGTGKSLDFHDEGGTQRYRLTTTGFLQMFTNILNDVTNTRSIGSSALAFKEVIANVVQAGTGSPLDLKNAGGTIIIQLPNGGGLTFGASLDFGAGDTHDVGDLTAGVRAFIGNNIKPETGKSLRIQDNAAGNAMTISAAEITLGKDIIGSGDDLRTLGASLKAMKEVITGIIRPGGAGLGTLLVKDANSTTAFTIGVGTFTLERDIVPGTTDTLTLGSSATPSAKSFKELIVNKIRPGTALNLDLRDSGGGNGLRITTSQINLYKSIVPDIADAVSVGAVGSPLKELFSNIIQAGTGKILIFQDEGGSTSFRIRADGRVVYSTDIETNPNNTLKIGEAGAQFKELYVGIVKPGATHDLHLQDSDGNVVMEIDDTGIAWFAGAPVAKAAALTGEDATAIDAVYGATEEAVLNNVRTRIGELESRFQAYNLLS